MLMRGTNAALAFGVRSFPFEAVRWRFIPISLGLCRRVCRQPLVKTIRARHGFRACVDVSDWFGRHFYVTGEYEPATTRIVKALVGVGDSFIDVGANVGYFTLLAAKLVGPRGRVFSFEPMSGSHRLLEHNVRLNQYSQCTISDIAAFNETGSAQFYEGPVGHSGTSSLRELHKNRSSLEVQTRRLDDLIPEDARIVAAKIDVEGAECHVLEGMRNILERSKPDLIIEVSPEYLFGMDRRPSDIDALLQPLGYQPYVIEHEGVRPVSTLEHVPSAQFNALLTTRRALPQDIPVLS